MDSCVVVVRLRTGDEILAILNGELDNRVRIEHPYFVKINPSGSVTMYPYCPLTDEVHFELERADINFLAVANDEIATKFMRMISVPMHDEPEVIGEDHTSDLVSSDVTIANIIPGNTTKH